MKIIAPYIIALTLVLFSSCIKEDIIDDFTATDLRITNSLTSLAVGEQHQFETMYLNNVGLEVETALEWTSSDESVATISETGLVTALKTGTTTITVAANNVDEPISTTTTLQVAEETIIDNTPRSGMLISTSSYPLTGNFTLESNPQNNELILKLSNYELGDGLPGPYIYLSNNQSTTNGAFEVGRVKQLKGDHSYVLNSDEVGINQYKYILFWCKPINQKVGEGEFQK